MQLIPFTDYIFGNESEFLALVTALKIGDGSSIDATVTTFAKIPRADGNDKKKRHIVVTCGTSPCIVASLWRGFGVKVQRFPVPPVRSGRFVSKDGAGDAFAGGFLYGLMNEANLESC